MMYESSTTSVSSLLHKEGLSDRGIDSEFRFSVREIGFESQA